ncbi:hypothetical protein GCM10027047_15110 [Rhodococcus aerolatus]
MTDDELLVEVALTRLDHPGLELDELAAMVVRRHGQDLVLQLASDALVVRGELRGGAFESAVEQLVRIVLRLRDAPD